MYVREVSPPASEPVTLDEVTAHLRIDHDAENALLQAYITAARERAETLTGRSFASRQFELVMPAFPAAELRLPRPPLESVDGIKYRDTGGVLQALDSSRYRALTGAVPPVVEPMEGWPRTAERMDAVVVTFTSGAPVPETARAAIMQIVGRYEAHREPVVTSGRVATIPDTAERLLRPLRTGMEAAPA
jgi:uncharacterized phiE125 gp8 family phage protein